MIKEIDLLHNRKALVDSEDYDLVKQYRWCIASRGYACTPKGVKMHRLIMKAKNGETVDHINRDKLDNRKCNLRIVTTSQNILNSKINIKNKSGYRGVNYHKARKQWRAYITINYKHIGLGWFKTKEEAIAARKKGEKDYLPDFIITV